MSIGDQSLVSVVIPTLNAGEGFGLLLETIQAQQVEGRLEVVVVDSQSEDGTAERARRAGAQVLTIPRLEFSHGGTRNRAVEASSGQFVALTVQDALPTDRFWLARLLAPLIEHKEIAGSFGLQVAPDTADLLARTKSSLWCEANRQPLLKTLESAGKFWEMAPEERLDLVRFDNVGSCIRREVWARNPFPEFNYGEDMAWAKDVLLTGHSIAYLPTAQVWHCHERDHLYELRRAYIDGGTRVRIVDWPSPELEGHEVWAILRRMWFFLRTNRYDDLVEADQIRQFLRAERYHCETSEPSKAADLYLAVLAFAMALTERALRYRPAGRFACKEWIELLRFASVSVVGQELGSAAAVAQEPRPALDRVLWAVGDRYLGKGV